MGEHFFHKLPMLIRVESTVKRDDPPATLKAIASHFEFVHGVYILDMHLDAGTIRSFRCPHVQIFMSSCFEIQGIVAVV